MLHELMAILCEYLFVSTYDVVLYTCHLFHFPGWELVQGEMTHIHTVQVSLHCEAWLTEDCAEHFESIESSGDTSGFVTRGRRDICFLFVDQWVS